MIQDSLDRAPLTISPGTTVDENAVVAAGALVYRDVPENRVSAGVPAKLVKYLDQKHRRQTTSEAGLFALQRIIDRRKSAE